MVSDELSVNTMYWSNGWLIVNGGTRAISEATHPEEYKEVMDYLAKNPKALIPEPVPPPPSPEMIAMQARAARDARLVEHDTLVDIAERDKRRGDPTAEARLAALDAYAVALCNWPASAGFPDVVTLPSLPEGV